MRSPLPALIAISAVAFCVGWAFPAPHKADIVLPPRATVCVTDSEVLTPPKGSEGMRLKTTTTCKEAK